MGRPRTNLTTIASYFTLIYTGVLIGRLTKTSHRCVSELLAQRKNFNKSSEAMSGSLSDMFASRKLHAQTAEVKDRSSLLSGCKSLTTNFIALQRRLKYRHEKLRVRWRSCMSKVALLQRKSGEADLKSSQKEKSNLVSFETVQWIKMKNANIDNQHEKHLKKNSLPWTLKRKFLRYSVAAASFNSTHVFEVERKVHPSNFLSCPGSGAKHILEAKRRAVKMANSASDNSHLISAGDFIDGIFSLDEWAGIKYEMHFKNVKANSITSVKLIRPFGHFELVKILPRLKKRKPELINLIVPLFGRIDRFRRFIEVFTNVCIQLDGHVFLTIVFYGTNRDLREVGAILERLKTEHGFWNFRLIARAKAFSRGQALNDGVTSWKSGNVLMFFCDVDMTFTKDFLDRCRRYTKPGKQVYFPVVFSLYNPDLIEGSAQVNSSQETLHLDYEHGFWRLWGYGMTCQYRNDNIRVGGFDNVIKGWGQEDRRLYFRFMKRSAIEIVRSPDPGLFHRWHRKDCGNIADRRQHKECIHSIALNEGTKQQIAEELNRVREELRVIKANRSQDGIARTKLLKEKLHH